MTDTETVCHTFPPCDYHQAIDNLKHATHSRDEAYRRMLELFVLRRAKEVLTDDDGNDADAKAELWNAPFLKELSNENVELDWADFTDDGLLTVEATVLLHITDEEAIRRWKDRYEAQATFEIAEALFGERLRADRDVEKLAAVRKAVGFTYIG